jgi:ATP phosphoribosyltransferase
MPAPPVADSSADSVRAAPPSARSTRDLTPTDPAERATLRIALPKGRMQVGVLGLLRDAGVTVRLPDRGYRPRVGLERVEAKLLKPHNIVGMLAAGARDVGFAGADWIAEFGADVVEVLDTGLDPVRLVAAAPQDVLDDAGRLPERRLVVATEYERLARLWIADRGLNAIVLRTYGATEVFPPEDADCIVDNTATGATLEANRLAIVDELLTSSTRLYASRRAMDDADKRRRIEELAMLLRSVLEARRRVIVEVNVAAERLESVLGVLPAMDKPTLAQLAAGGYAVKAAILRTELPTLVPKLKQLGATDLLVTTPTQIVP